MAHSDPRMDATKPPNTKLKKYDMNIPNKVTMEASNRAPYFSRLLLPQYVEYCAAVGAPTTRSRSNSSTGSGINVIGSSVVNDFLFFANAILEVESA